MHVDINEVEHIVTTINQTIYEEMEWAYAKNENSIFVNNPPLLSYSSDGYAVGIEFLGLQIWCSENDDRKIIDDNRTIIDDNDYEDLYTFLIREIKRISHDVSLIEKLLFKKEI